MTNTRLITLLALSAGLLFSTSGCKKSDPTPADENELITTVRLKFTEGSNSQTFEWKDIDGDGGKAPVIQNIALKTNKTYKVDVSFLDESKMPIFDITEEVAKEKDEHLVIITPAPASLFVYTYGDKDSRNFPVGLTGTAKTSGAGTGTLKVVLRHQPPINGKPVKDGTATLGSSDADVLFNLAVTN